MNAQNEMNEQTMDLVQHYLERANTYGLQNEVVYAALLTMKENPTFSIVEALGAGCVEWNV